MRLMHTKKHEKESGEDQFHHEGDDGQVTPQTDVHDFTPSLRRRT